MRAATVALRRSRARLAATICSPLISRRRRSRKGVRSAARRSRSAASWRARPMTGARTGRGARRAVEGRHCLRLVPHNRDEHSARAVVSRLRLHQGGDLARRVAAYVHRQIARRAVEGRHCLRLVPHNRDAVGLEFFAGGAEVEDHLGAGADDRHRRPSERLQVGTHVPGGGVVGRAVDAADAAGGHDGDARPVGQVQGAGHGGGAVATPCRDHRQVAQAHLSHVLGRGQMANLRLGQAHVHLSVYDAHGLRVGALLADARLQPERGVYVGGVGQPVSNHGGFEGDGGRHGDTGN